MGSSSPCTCNARVCNYHKKDSYGFDTGGAKIDENIQKEALKKTLSTFVDDISSPTAYFRTGVQTGSNESASHAALNKLRNIISSVTPIDGLTMDAFCVNVADSYDETSSQTPPEPFISEGYTLIKSKQDVYSVIIGIIIAIALFAIVGFIIYRYITCPCRKKHEKEMREAEALEYTT